MRTGNAYQQYKAQSIGTMTQEELLLLLYDELVKRALRAELALEKEDYPLFEASLDRCLAILRHLDDTLNQSYPISQELHRLYEFFSFELSRIKSGRRIADMQKLRPLLTDLRDTFRTASKNNKEEAIAEERKAQ